jgi:hypothetical protein
MIMLITIAIKIEPAKVANRNAFAELSGISLLFYHKPPLMALMKSTLNDNCYLCKPISLSQYYL